MSAQFDPTKPVQTRDGRKVTVLRTDLNHPQPIVAIVTDHGERAFRDSVQYYSLNGSFTGACPSAWDLVNVPEKIENKIWVIFFRIGAPALLTYRPGQSQLGGAVALKEFTVSAEPGEGLSDEPEDDF